MTASDLSSLSEAADFFDREATRAEGFLRAAAAVRAVGSLVQAANEARARRESLDAEHEAAISSYAEAKRSAKEAIEHTQAQLVEANAAVVAARSEAQRILDAATESARASGEQAVAAGAAVLAEAERQAADIIATAKAQAASFDPAIASGRRELDRLTTDITVARATLDEVNALIEAGRARFR